jgi:DNA anti-recombination protein RmuC
MDPAETENKENNGTSENQENTHQLKMANLPDSNLEKVRDILFGNQVRDFEQRFLRLEERLMQECSAIREDNKKRLDAIEGYFKQEVSSLNERIKNEQNNRDAAIKTVVNESKNVSTSLQSRLTQLDEQVNRSQSELREQILEQSKTLHDEIREKYEEIVVLLQRESEELRHQKTDRSTLATLLNDLAFRLNS